jgi:N-formylglutamate amidohydrolase
MSDNLPLTYHPLGDGTSSSTNNSPDTKWICTQGQEVPPAFPILLSFGHSGQYYPQSFLAQTRLTLANLRRNEDFIVDELFAPALSHHHLGFVKANFARAFLDVNRDPHELDPLLFREPLPTYAAPLSLRVQAGLGIIPRLGHAGKALYHTPPSLKEALARIALCHTPYHRALTSQLAVLKQRFGHALLLDCHSMPSLGPAGPDIVLGTHHGQSAAAGIVAACSLSLSQLGYRLAFNHPYAGGYTTTHHGTPKDYIHVVQIEIDRALYMDDGALSSHCGFLPLAQNLMRFLAELCKASKNQGFWS